MALPTITKNWRQLLTAGTPGARVTFTSVLDTMQQVAFRIKDFLCNGSGATTKYTVLWSSSGGTGPSAVTDHTDRITSPATWTPRATTAGATQAWVVLVGGQGEQILLSFQGATDDVMRVGMSPSGLYVLAGNTSNQPTAVDEQLVIGGSNISMVNVATTGDRILHLWARDDAKGFRVALYRTGALAGPVWFVEEFISGCTPPAAVTPAVCGGGFLPGSTTAGALTSTALVNQSAVSIRATVATSQFSTVCFIGCEGFGNSNAPASYTTPPEAQGGGFTPYPLSLHSITAGAKGRWGNLIDMWIVSPAGMVPGDGFGTSYQFHQVNALLWPNPANTPPIIL
jgi:hypothetical protein